jgi:hypothetical protein
LREGTIGPGHEAYDFLREAMTCCEKAEAIRPPGNDDALLRWNACARILMMNRLAPLTDDGTEPSLEQAGGSFRHRPKSHSPPVRPAV